MNVRVWPEVWVRLPDTPVELHAEHVTVAQRDHNGIWHLDAGRGRLLVRVVLPDGRRSWPYPVTPLPWRV